MSCEDVVKAAKLCLGDHHSDSDHDYCEECPFGDGDDPVVLTCESFLQAVAELNKDDKEDSSNLAIYVPKAHLDQIMEQFPTRELQLQITQEECNELAIAVSKLNRADIGDKDLDNDSKRAEFRANLVEEMSHVAVMLAALQVRFGVTQDEINAEYLKKAKKYGFDLSKYDFVETSKEREADGPSWLPFALGEEVYITRSRISFTLDQYDISIRSKSGAKTFSMSPCTVKHIGPVILVAHGDKIFRFIELDGEIATLKYEGCYRRSYER